jgi:hypothetical protein
MKYTLHKIIRTKWLQPSVNSIDRQDTQPSANSDQPSAQTDCVEKDSTVTLLENTDPHLYELLFERGSLSFLPSSMVKIYNLEDTWCSVASEIRAPWARLIIDNNRIPKDSWGVNIKIEDTLCMFPDLVKDSNPSFYCSGESIAVPLSYISNYPNRKVEIIYLGPGISLDFLQSRAILKRDLKTVGNYNYYCCVDGKIKNGKEL